MGPIRLTVGAEWLLDGRAYRVVRQPTPDRFVALDAKFHREEEFSLEQILRLYSDGQLQFASADIATTEVDQAQSHARVMNDLTDREQALLKQRWQAIEPLARLTHRPRQEDYQRRSAELAAAGEQLSARSIRRYYHMWIKSGKDRLALLPTTRRSGGRGRTRQHSLLERYPQFKRLVEEAISSVYLTMARRPISAVVERVFEDLQRLNARLPAGHAIPIPRRDALYRAIGRRIAQFDPWEVDRARWGKQIADRRHAPTTPARLATRILERVEIDHSPLKVVVGTEAGPIGQPWLTVLIDYHSRLIVGFCLGFEPPSYAVIMESLRHAILPKHYLAERYPKIRGQWPCFGLPEKLVCDRGSDLTSKDLENAAFQLGFELDFNPPRSPHLKGTVESFFGGLNDQLMATLPGRTFRSWEKRADYNPDDGPLITYEALVEVVHIYLVDVYAISKHPTSHRTRLETWQESAADHPPCLPATPDELVVLLSKRVERTLLPRGIELAGMFYTSDELMALRAELAAGNLHERRMQVRYNPWNLGSVWVLNPLDQRYLQAQAVDRALEGLTEYQWKVLRRAVRDRFDRPEHLMNLAAGRNAVRDVVDEALQKPSRRRRVRARRYAQPPPVEQTGPVVLDEDAWTDVTTDEDVPGAADQSLERADRDGDTFQAEDTRNDKVDPSHVPSTSQHNAPEDFDPDDIDVDDWDIAAPDL